MPETAVVVTVAAAAAIVETPPGGIPAHVILLYPFADGAQIDGLLDDLRVEFSRFPAFALTLRRLDRFPGPPAVLYAVPEPEERFLAMTDALAARFGFLPYGGVHNEVIPHLTIGSVMSRVRSMPSRPRRQPRSRSPMTSRRWRCGRTSASAGGCSTASPSVNNRCLAPLCSGQVARE